MLNIMIIILSALASLISVSVGDGDFRITFGIVILISSFHLFKPKHPVLLSFVAGLVIVFLRIFVDSLSIDMTASIASSYLLEVFFYVTFAFLYNWAITTNTSKYPLPLVVALVLCDTGSNTVEFALRYLASDTVWAATSFYSILVAAFVRAVVIVLIVWLFENITGQKSKGGFDGISR